MGEDSEVISRRIRNRIIEYLELAASSESQRKYQTSVPHVNVVNELINQWQDWVPYDDPSGHFCEPVFTLSEQEAVLRFHTIWDSVAKKLSPAVQGLEDFIHTSEWNKLQRSARDALSEFRVRGKLSED